MLEVLRKSELIKTLPALLAELTLPALLAELALFALLAELGEGFEVVINIFDDKILLTEALDCDDCT